MIWCRNWTKHHKWCFFFILQSVRWQGAHCATQTGRRRRSRTKWGINCASANLQSWKAKNSHFCKFTNSWTTIPPKFQTAFDGANLFSIRLIALRIQNIHWMFCLYAVFKINTRPLGAKNTYPRRFDFLLH